MRQKQRELIKYLASQTKPVPSQVLAQELGVSIRSVKSYVSSINQESPQKVILSGKQGYQIVGGYIPTLPHTQDAIPQNHQERTHYIIKMALIGHQSLDIFDLSETLFASYSTLKSDLAQMNKTYERFGIKFNIKKGMIMISGTEQDKRRLVSHVIFEETNSRFLDLKSLDQTFPGGKAKKIAGMIRTCFKKYDYYLNDFSFINLVLHFVILIERTEYGQYLNQETPLSDGAKETALADELAAQMETIFTIQLTEKEKTQIYVLIKTYVNYVTAEGIDDLKRLVGQDILSTTQELITAVNEVYMINLMNDNFLPSFALHIKGLKARITHKTYNKNPMLDNIKRDCRIIYDIAIYLVLALENRWNTAIPEDETAFIALHVGAELERQKLNHKKIPCALLCPGYYGIEERIYNQLLLDFGNDIYITAAVTQFSDLEEHTFDLLFTTVEPEFQENYDTILIAPFKLRDKKAEISEKISQIRLNAKKKILQNNYQDFFDPRLFYVNPDFTGRDQLFEQVCHEMEQLGFVHADYLTQVKDRERASSTAFGDLALPHSIHMNAIKTCIAVILSRDGIEWEPGKKVHVVLLTAINQVDRSHFTDIYEALVSIFDSPLAMTRLRSTTNYAEYIDFLMGV